jgi:hypothetical protein
VNLEIVDSVGREANARDLKGESLAAEKQKPEAQSRRNCWRVARSVSPDISPRFGLSGLR